MFGRVTVAQGPPEQADESVRVIQEKVLPAARQIDGYKGVLSLLDRSTGKGLTVTLWESEDAMRASEEAADRIRDDAAQTAGLQVTAVERYEVVIDERG